MQYLEKICDVSNATVRFSVPSQDLIEVGVRDEVTIIDEFDHVMLDRMAQFSKKVGASNRVIGLTATAKEDLNDFEFSYLTLVRQFRLYNSMIQPSAADLVEPEFKTIEQLMNDSKLARIAKLIYCETEEFEAIKDCF